VGAATRRRVIVQQSLRRPILSSFALVLGILIGGTALHVPGVTGDAAALTGCSRTVGTGQNLQYAIDHTPSGGTLCLTGSITASSTIRIHRSNLTIDGRGYVLKGSGYHIVLQTYCATNITVKRLRVVGDSPRPGVYTPGDEHAHGVEIAGGKNITFAGVTVRNAQGDGFYLTKCGNSTWADTIRIRDGAAYGTTRHGIGIVAARHVRISNMGFKNVGIHVLSIEPDWSAGYAPGATDIVFSGGRSTGWIGRYTDGTTGTQAVYIGTPYGAQSGMNAPIVSGITIGYLRVLDSRYGIWSQVTASGGYRISNVTFIGNRGARGSWWTDSRGVVTCQDTSGFRVINNSQPVTAGQGMYMARSLGCSSASASGNVGSGLAGQIRH